MDQLDELKAGDGIVVQERVGSLGGTIVSVRPAPEGASQSKRSGVP
jgi:hypothetical protein